jgi:hypothetical protein
MHSTGDFTCGKEPRNTDGSGGIGIYLYATMM